MLGDCGPILLSTRSLLMRSSHRYIESWSLNSPRS